MLAFRKSLTALMINAEIDPKPTREFIFGEPFLSALKPSKSKSETFSYSFQSNILIDIEKFEHIK